jgi:hypothetical protein|nr:MAG TPA: hypothetical protein [Caudoviricetes sp.]
MKANEVLNFGKEVLISNSKNRKSIYKNSLFDECKSDKEKKSLRIKLRRKLQSFLGTFLQVEKNPTKIKELQKVWKEYAKEVYNNVNEIVDNNSTQDNKELVKRFISVMNK